MDPRRRGPGKYMHTHANTTIMTHTHIYTHTPTHIHTFTHIHWATQHNTTQHHLNFFSISSHEI